MPVSGSRTASAASPCSSLPDSATSPWSVATSCVPTSFGTAPSSVQVSLDGVVAQAAPVGRSTVRCARTRSRRRCRRPTVADEPRREPERCVGASPSTSTSLRSRTAPSANGGSRGAAVGVRRAQERPSAEDVDLVDPTATTLAPVRPAKRRVRQPLPGGRRGLARAGHDRVVGAAGRQQRRAGRPEHADAWGSDGAVGPPGSVVTACRSPCPTGCRSCAGSRSRAARGRRPAGCSA